MRRQRRGRRARRRAARAGRAAAGAGARRVPSAPTSRGRCRRGDLHGEARRDREQEEPVDRQVVEEAGAPAVPARDALEHGVVVEVEREERGVGEREHAGAGASEPQQARESVCSTAIVASATPQHREQRVGREIPGVRHPERPERRARAARGTASSRRSPSPTDRTTATVSASASAATGERHRVGVQVAEDEGERRELRDRPGLVRPRARITRDGFQNHHSGGIEPSSADRSTLKLAEVPEHRDEQRRQAAATATTRAAPGARATGARPSAAREDGGAEERRRASGSRGCTRPQAGYPVSFASAATWTNPK